MARTGPTTGFGGRCRRLGVGPRPRDTTRQRFLRVGVAGAPTPAAACGIRFVRGLAARPVTAWCAGGQPEAVGVDGLPVRAHPFGPRRRLPLWRAESLGFGGCGHRRGDERRRLGVLDLRFGRVASVLRALVGRPISLLEPWRRSGARRAHGKFPHLGDVDDRGLVGARLRGVRRATLADRGDPVTGDPIDPSAFTVAVPVAVRPGGRRLGVDVLQRGPLLEVGIEQNLQAGPQRRNFGAQGRQVVGGLGADLGG
ncbi:hypothetical protein MYSI104531_27240 [Mycobacterium simiae]